MIEIILGIIILALLGYIVWKDHHFSNERKILLNAALSKTSIEFATANKITEKEEEKVEESLPEFISQDTLDDDEFVAGLRKSIDEEEVKE